MSRAIEIDPADLIAALTGSRRAAESSNQVSDDIEARALLDLLSDIRQPRTRYQIGDLVRQCEHFDTYTFGRCVCVVSHVFPAPYLEHTTPTSELRNDMLVLARIGKSQQPQEFAVQSWRFELYTGPVSR